MQTADIVDSLYILQQRRDITAANHRRKTDDPQTPPHLRTVLNALEENLYQADGILHQIRNVPIEQFVQRPELFHIAVNLFDRTLTPVALSLFPAPPGPDGPSTDVYVAHTPNIWDIPKEFKRT